MIAFQHAVALVCKQFGYDKPFMVNAFVGDDGFIMVQTEDPFEMFLTIFAICMWTTTEYLELNEAMSHAEYRMECVEPMLAAMSERACLKDSEMH